MVNKYTYLTIGLTTVLVTVTGYIGVTIGNGGFHHGNGEDTFDYMSQPIAKTTDETESSRKLVEFTKTEFLTREVLKVSDNVYVAIGWALSNSIMIEGDDGIIIIDTTEAPQSMKEIMVEFRKITSKPVLAIMITHFHTDHLIGTSFIINEEKKVFPNTTIEIYTHELTKQLMFGFSDTYDIALKRGLRQLGAILPKNPDARTGAGLGPELRVDTETAFYIPVPTVTFSDRASYTIAGIKFELIYTPGETDDQITIFLPDTKVVFPGDNIYKTFPNLYAIRGSPARNSKRWYQSLDDMRALGGEFLVGSHTRPVEGKDAVYDTLLVYRDGIKYIHDQTVRLLNKGYFPGEIVEQVKLPENLAKHPNLQEHYGSVPWSVKGVFANYIGWFSGDPKDLHPMTQKDRASRMARLVAYGQTRKTTAVEVMLQEAQISHMNSHNHYLLTGKHILSDDKWALELADVVLEIGSLDANLTQVARQIKVSALRAIGVEQISANGRNYYLTYAMEVEYNITIQRTKAARAFVINDSPVYRVLDMLCAKVRGLHCQHNNYTVGLSFTDLNKGYAVSLRNSVCDVMEPVPSNVQFQVHLSTASDTFKSIAAEDLDLDTEVTLGTVKVVSGTVATYKKFLDCFDPINSV
ncbi:linear primary-alkylsulfatase-like [Styela clava]|uniref:putative alkyl/aryl-sulfatase YjcS n=1 Tax=Styela clava TaxID=7725 RepID=UPI0019392DAF|nr:putative alkyl/aryl-sulfatase YjcS [Styela clava]